MVIKTASPGVIINEVDLTKGTSDAITTNIAAMVGPFEKGPVDDLVLIETEAELQRTFGNPTKENYEYWWTIANYLEYGGVCYVIRCDDEAGDAGEALDSSRFGLQEMRNAADILQQQYDGYTGPYVKNDTHFFEDYNEKELGATGGGSPAHFIARTPGEWGNAIGVAVIDAGADYSVLLSAQNIRHYNRALAAHEDVLGPNGELPLSGGREFDETLLGGFKCGDYYKARITGNWENFTDNELTVYPIFFQVYDSPNSDKEVIGGGYIMAPDSTLQDENGNMRYNDRYRLCLTFGSIYQSAYVSIDGGNTLSYGISSVYKIGEFKLYKTEAQALNLLANTLADPDNPDAGAGFSPDIRTDGDGINISNNNKSLEATVSINDPNNPSGDPMRLNLIWEPNQFTKEQAIQFGWPNNPRQNQKVYPDLSGISGPTELGESYIWNSLTELWTNLYKPQEGDLVTDGKYVYGIRAIGDWYSTQVAFSGIRSSSSGYSDGTGKKSQERWRQCYRL
jgi:hypothetical protein